MLYVILYIFCACKAKINMTVENKFSLGMRWRLRSLTPQGAELRSYKTHTILHSHPESLIDWLHSVAILQYLIIYWSFMRILSRSPVTWWIWLLHAWLCNEMTEPELISMSHTEAIPQKYAETCRALVSHVLIWRF